MATRPASRAGNQKDDGMNGNGSGDRLSVEQQFLSSSIGHSYSGDDESIGSDAPMSKSAPEGKLKSMLKSKSGSVNCESVSALSFVWY